MNENDIPLEDDADYDDDDEVITIMERILRDYWESHFGLDAPALAEQLVETLGECGYEIRSTLVD
jgi:hypothetical protein